MEKKVCVMKKISFFFFLLRINDVKLPEVEKSFNRNIETHLRSKVW